MNLLFITFLKVCYCCSLVCITIPVLLLFPICFYQVFWKILDLIYTLFLFVFNFFRSIDCTFLQPYCVYIMKKYALYGCIFGYSFSSINFKFRSMTNEPWDWCKFFLSKSWEGEIIISPSVINSHFTTIPEEIWSPSFKVTRSNSYHWVDTS